MTESIDRLKEIAKRLRYEILTATSAAGSGHPTSCLSAVELMTSLMFGGFFRTDLKNPEYQNNDRLIFSKGHAAPLLYALYVLAGEVTQEQFQKLRKIDSNLEGHPTREFPFTELPTGSLGQGLSVGVGMALNAKYLDLLPYKTYVLLGDSELAEGSNYEAMQIASFYQLDNLIAIVDVNRLGQRGPTMLGHDLEQYQERWQSFGWQAICVEEGQDFNQLNQAFKSALNVQNKPIVILAKTQKGAGVEFIQDNPSWHGKVLSPDQLNQALDLIGIVDKNIVETPSPPESLDAKTIQLNEVRFINSYELESLVSPRQAYGDGLIDICNNKDLVVLDTEVSNSTHTDAFAKLAPNRFFEMFIAEQNMVSTALGLSRRGKKPFISTFGAFFSRAADQLRMAQYSHVPLMCAGTHVGISIGQDGGSQMALEDIALFRSLQNSIILYPADAQACRWMVSAAYNYTGLTYLRITRNEVPVIYGVDEEFPPGKSKVLRQSSHDQVTILSAGITLHESLIAYSLLAQQGINARVIDLYSVKPIDTEAITWAVRDTSNLIIVEDHHPQGGLGEAVFSCLVNCQQPFKTKHLSVNVEPHSGTTKELLKLANIDSTAIVQAVLELLS